MLPSFFQRRIADLDEFQFTELCGRLLAEEAQSIGLPHDGFTYSLNVKAGDEGLDGEAKDVPEGASDVLPAGSSGYQFKAVKGALSALKLEEEVQKPASRRLIEEGGVYVLAWSKDLNPKDLEAAKTELARLASNIREDAQTTVWSARHIAQLCARHPVVPQNLGLVQFGPVKSLDWWLRQLKSADRPYFPDKARTELGEEIHRRLAKSDGGLILRLSGDSGIGKSRAVAEALNVDEYRDSTFYAPTTDGLDDFLSLIGADDQLEVVLVVDEVGAGDVRRLEEIVAAAGKGIRLVTIGLASSSRSRADRDEIQLDGLDRNVMEDLIKSEGDAADAAASFVAEATEGYPQMAFEILDEIKRDPAAADLSRLAETTGPRALLERAVPEDFRKPLGVLALFQSVGCKDDMESEIDELAKRFPVTGSELRRTIRNADGRYIRLAGRRCYVRPKLVATWLAGEILEEHGGEVIKWVTDLSGGLQDRFVSQLDNFGSGPSGFQGVLATFIEESDRFKDPPAFDEAAARFLRAAAAVAPEQVAASIDALVDEATPEQLRALPRRDLVWALEYLLWWPETYERAIGSLFILAQHESETWANNATGEFVESFQIVLGGTLVPHADRLKWLQAQLGEGDPTQLILIAKAAAAGLSTHHSRMVSGPRGRLEPRDWHPQTEAEVLEAHRDSLDLLLACVDRAEAGSSEHREIVALISRNLRGAVAFGLIDSVEKGIQARNWTQEDRAAISGALRDVRRYDKPSAELDERITALLEALSGEDFEERLAVVFATKPWDLIEGEDWQEVPPAVQELVDEVANDSALLSKALEVAATAPDDGSHFQFFMRSAERIGAETVAKAALSADPPAWPAVAAALTQTKTPEQAEWADKILRDTLESSADQFPVLLRALPLTPARVELVVKVIQEGTLPGDAFADLLYGARIRDLEKADALTLIEAIGSAGSERGLEGALGMLHQWVEVHAEDAPDAVPTAVELAVKAAQFQKPSSMTSHYLEQLFQQLPIDYEAKAKIWEELAVHSDIGASRDHLPLIQSLLEENPESASELILAVLDKAVSPPYQRWAFSLEEGKLLSAAARATSAETIWKHLSRYDDTNLRFLLRHTSWAGDKPEPLVREFLLSDRRAELEDEADVNFFNTLGVVGGPFHLAMERERDRASSWLASLKDTSAEDWAKRLVAGYEQRVEAEKIRDEEQDLEFR